MKTSTEVTSCLVCGSENSELVTTTKTMMGPQTENWNFVKCLDCDMVYLSPRVKPVELSAYYTDSYIPYRGPSAWGRYSSFVENDLAKIDSKRVNTVKKYATKDASTILDIGCGKPSFLLKANQQLGLKAIGQDFSDKGWAENTAQYDSLELHTGSLFDLPKTINADVITMWHYLEHDYEPSKTLQHLSQSHKEDALLIIEVPNFDSHTRKKYGEHWSGFHSPRHTGLYTIETMTKLLENNGWSLEDSYTYGTLDPYTLDWMSKMEQQTIDWSSSMEKHFTSYVLGKVLSPYYFLDRYFSLGFMTVVAKNRKKN